MSKKDNLKDYLTDLYEGIASKKPDASKNPQKFREEIEAIQGGTKPTGSIDITTNGTHDVTNYASAKVAVPSKPIEISNEAEIAALETGIVFKYTGESGTYEKNAFYYVEDMLTLTFTIACGNDTKTYTAEKGKTWQDFVDSDFNDGRVYIFNNGTSNLCYLPSESATKDGTYTMYLSTADGTRTTAYPTDEIVAGGTYGAAAG